MTDKLLKSIQYKFFHIDEFEITINDKPLMGFEGRRHFKIINHDGIALGWINYYPKWKKYVFTTVFQTILDTKCLEDIVSFMKDIKI